MTNQTATLEIRSESSLMISINNLRIICRYKKSDNGQYILAFCDGDPHKGLRGYRKEGMGYYFLIANNVLTVMGKLERPNDGKVADNGWFIINDWLFTDNLESKVYCFDEKGNIIIQKELKANLGANAISRSGNFALFQTANSDNQFGNSLFFYDLINNELLWKKECDFKWPIEYSISEDERVINLHYADIGIISLDWEGAIIDMEAYLVKYLSSLRGDRFVYEALNKITERDMNSVFINLLEKGLIDIDMSQYAKSIGYKFLGEIYEGENLHKTIEYYEKALECNPKIGIKRKLSALKLLL